MKTATERFNDLKAAHKESLDRFQPVEWIAARTKALHGELNNRLCSILDRDNADFAMKLIYAASIFFANHTFFTTMQSAIVNTLAVGYLWKAEEHVMEKKTRINLLHSIALASFMNLNPLAIGGAGDAIVKGPASLLIISSAVLAANDAGETRSVEKV